MPPSFSRGRRGRAARAAALAVLAAAGMLAWRLVLLPWREDRNLLYTARTALRGLAELEQAYCYHAGRYTDDLLLLATMSPRPADVNALREGAFLPGSLSIEARPDRVLLSARARDRLGTAIAFEALRPSPGDLRIRRSPDSAGSRRLAP